MYLIDRKVYGENTVLAVTVENASDKNSTECYTYMARLDKRRMYQ